MDMNGVLQAAFDPVTGKLRTVDAGSPSGITTTGKLDAEGVWAAVYDRATNSVRTVTV